MATYLNTNGSLETFDLTERYIYGSSRLGVYKEPVSMLATPATPDFNFLIPGYRQYELSNHLGNVTTTITAQKVPLHSGTTITGFAPQIVKSFDYSPFGVTRLDFDVTTRLSGDFAVAEAYRYGFNGMEKDDEVKGSGNSYDFGARMLDPRLGRFLSLDPLAREFPSETNYSSTGNNPIYLIDVDGKYKYPAGKKASYTKNYPVFTKYLSTRVENDVMNSSILVNAFSYATNPTKSPGTQGLLNSSELRNAVKWNSGPTIEITSAPGGVNSANGFFVEGSGTIQINQDLIEFIESVDAADRGAAMFAVLNTVYHETAHYGETVGGGITRVFDSEAGDTFEEAAHGDYNWNARWSGMIIQRDADGKLDYGATLTEAKVAMEEMGQTEEGAAALPSSTVTPDPSKD